MIVSTRLAKVRFKNGCANTILMLPLADPAENISGSLTLARIKHVIATGSNADKKTNLHDRPFVPTSSLIDEVKIKLTKKPSRPPIGAAVYNITPPSTLLGSGNVSALKEIRSDPKIQFTFFSSIATYSIHTAHIGSCKTYTKLAPAAHSPPMPSADVKRKIAKIQIFHEAAHSAVEIEYVTMVKNIVRARPILSQITPNKIPPAAQPSNSSEVNIAVHSAIYYTYY